MSGGHQSGGVLIAARKLSRIYWRGAEAIRALDAVTFEVRRGEFIATVGPSGAGKTTLLNLLGCMDAPTSGTLEIAGQEVQGFSEAQRTRYRRQVVGFVFQHFGLVPTLTVAENVALPLLFSRRRPGERVPALLERVGLRHRAKHRPHELSGGEMQRVAIARALVNEPTLLLADEPTGNLDSATGESIITLFQDLHAQGLTILVVTHNPRLSLAAERQLELRDGTLTETASPPLPGHGSGGP